MSRFENKCSVGRRRRAREAIQIRPLSPVLTYSQRFTSFVFVFYVGAESLDRFAVSKALHLFLFHFLEFDIPGFKVMSESRKNSEASVCFLSPHVHHLHIIPHIQQTKSCLKMLSFFFFFKQEAETASEDSA